MEQKKDIFDRIMEMKLFNWFDPFYKKHKEVLLYIFFGGLSFVLNIVCFVLFERMFGMGELVANVLAWIITVLFVFFTNRIWVFDGKVETKKDFAKQMIDFYIGRIATLILEELILFIFITKAGFNSLIVKIIAQITVIVTNYIISKLWVFKKKKTDI